MPHAATRPTATRRRRHGALVALALASLTGCGGSHPAAGTTTTPPRAPAVAKLPGDGAQSAAVARFTKLGVPVFCGGGHLRLVALTFDDGPGPYTPIVLRELGKARAHATFFLVGRSIQRFPQAAAPERAQAEIGEHTMTHPNLPALAFADAKSEISHGRAAALQATGGPVDLFRPPFGAHSPAIDAEVASEGMAQILWSVDSEDSRVLPPADFHEISANVRRRARPGSIVLMHENRGQTIRALRSILPALARRGLRAVTVAELLAADPPSTTQLRAGLGGCRRGSS